MWGGKCSQPPKHLMDDPKLSPKLHSKEVAILLPTQQPLVQFPVLPKKFGGKIILVPKVNLRCWFEES